MIFRAGRHSYVDIGPKIALGKTLVSSASGLGVSTTTFGGGANASPGLIL